MKQRKKWVAPGDTLKPRVNFDLHPKKTMICVGWDWECMCTGKCSTVESHGGQSALHSSATPHEKCYSTRPNHTPSRQCQAPCCTIQHSFPPKTRMGCPNIQSSYQQESRIIGKLEEGRSVTSVAAEFGIAHNIVSRLWRQFQTTGTAIQGFSSGRPRGTTPADNRYIVLQARRNRQQTAGEIARHTTRATARPISRFTVAGRLHGCGLFARRPVRCVPLTPAHRRRRSLWCREHRNWRDNEWGPALFTDESRFSLSSDFHRILIWREQGSRNHPSNMVERDRYGGRGVLVWGGIMLGSSTDLHIFDAG
ncbi:transposable element Tcb2 transposase [Trichonephila clavipes]|nr:transposable element Tcb2 transposase [Trichonephila clavipes]